MDQHDAVFFREDPRRIGIIIDTEDDDQGKTRYLVSWKDEKTPTWHFKPELGLEPPNTRNVVNGTISGLSIQTGRIIGDVNITGPNWP